MGGAHLGPFKIELALLARGLSRGDLGRGVTLCRSAGIELSFRQRLAARQGSRALDIKCGDEWLCLRAFHVGGGLLDSKVVRARIDDEQKIALLDELTILEIYELNINRTLSRAPQPMLPA